MEWTGGLERWVGDRRAGRDGKEEEGMGIDMGRHRLEGRESFRGASIRVDGCDGKSGDSRMFTWCFSVCSS